LQNIINFFLYRKNASKNNKRASLTLPVDTVNRSVNNFDGEDFDALVNLVEKHMNEQKQTAAEFTKRMAKQDTKIAGLQKDVQVLKASATENLSTNQPNDDDSSFTTTPQPAPTAYRVHLFDRRSEQVMYNNRVHNKQNREKTGNLDLD
jgi:hypothetical protein